MIKRYFDLHCDTATALYDRSEVLDNSTCHLSSDDIKSFEEYSQVFAVFSKPGLSDDECYKRFFKVVDNFKKSNRLAFASCGADMPSHILSVEDARLLAGDITRLRVLFDSGVRILTPLWTGETCIGGSYDTSKGLTDFGRSAVDWCFNNGVIPDVSHASVCAAEEILDMGIDFGLPVIASHSNSFDICPHPRNIPLSLANKLKQTGGIIGICLHGPHLGISPDLETVFRHIDFFAEHIGSDRVALGCDFDGTSELPSEITKVSDVQKIADIMIKHGYPDDTVDGIFYKNAYEFFESNLKVPGKENK
ncbi:MAG: membrane dipeptidase [Clostridia bacterium]|nr:membrane dipeptidase [Clostridia bacterium]